MLSRGENKLHAYFESSSFDTLNIEVNGDGVNTVDLSRYYDTWLNLVVAFTSGKNYEWGVYSYDGTELGTLSDRSSGNKNGYNYVEVGTDFTGLIRGLVVLDSASTVELTQMTTSDIQDSANFYGVDFTTDGIRSGATVYMYGSESGSESMGSSRDITFTTKWFKDDSTSDMTGTYDDSNIAFDGTTCEDGRKVFYVDDRRYNAHFDIETWET